MKFTSTSVLALLVAQASTSFVQSEKPTDMMKRKKRALVAEQVVSSEKQQYLAKKKASIVEHKKALHAEQRTSSEKPTDTKKEHKKRELLVEQHMSSKKSAEMMKMHKKGESVGEQVVSSEEQQYLAKKKASVVEHKKALHGDQKALRGAALPMVPVSDSERKPHSDPNLQREKKFAGPQTKQLASIGRVDIPYWTDYDGDDCAWYASHWSYCYDYGNTDSASGYTANEACTACGGGGYKVEWPLNWTDIDGDGCDVYEVYPILCLIAEDYRHMGYSANDVCTVCGGGKVQADLPGWVDSDGFDCNWYASHYSYCWDYGYLFENSGYVADDACVACGGGKLLQNS